MTGAHTISILGCGWLGLPLAGHLHAMGFRVYGSHHSAKGKEELKRWDIRPFKVDINQPEKATALFFKSKTLIITVPPSKGGREEYAHNLEKVLKRAKESGCENVVFTSSTAVYGESDYIQDEQSPVIEFTSRGHGLMAAETAIRNLYPNATTLRLGGLIGPNRHPGRFLAGKQDIVGSGIPVNFLTLEDGVRIIAELVSSRKFGKTYNLVCPSHPTKEEYYKLAAKNLDLPGPHFDPKRDREGYKLISGDRITSETGIEYLVKDWKAYLRSL